MFDNEMAYILELCSFTNMDGLWHDQYLSWITITPTKRPVHQATTQISVCSESSSSAWRRCGYLAVHSKDSDPTDSDTYPSFRLAPMPF